MTITNYQMIISPREYTVFPRLTYKYSLIHPVDRDNKYKVVDFSLVIQDWSPSDPSVFVNIAGPGTFSSSTSKILLDNTTSCSESGE